MSANNSNVVRAKPEARGAGDDYRIEILTIQDDEGTFSTIALNLPGAGSCGDTMTESISNAKEAIKAVLEVYTETGNPIPWIEVTPEMISEGVHEVLWIHA